MPEVPRVGDLEVEQDLEFADRDWRFQRIGMAAVAAILTLVALGLTGSGPFAHGEASQDGLRIVYNRYPRRGTETEMLVTAAVKGSEPLALEIAMEVPEQVQLVTVTPQPESMSSAPGRWVLHFPRRDAGPVAVTLTLLPKGWGRREMRFRQASGPPLGISQFVWF